MLKLSFLIIIFCCLGLMIEYFFPRSISQFLTEDKLSSGSGSGSESESEVDETVKKILTREDMGKVFHQVTLKIIAENKNQKIFPLKLKDSSYDIPAVQGDNQKVNEKEKEKEKEIEEENENLKNQEVKKWQQEANLDIQILYKKVKEGISDEEKESLKNQINEKLKYIDELKRNNKNQERI